MSRSSIAPVVASVAILFVAACGAGSDSPAAAPPTGSPAVAAASAAPASPSTDLLADLEVDGRSMHILCVGPTDTGRPTVIFESGLGGDAGQWSDVIQELDGSVRACAYDRAGDGQSEAAEPGRTTSDQVDDLRALLAAANVPPPYVLVGFSIGGWNVIAHEAAHPDDIAGAVMVDVRPPAASQRWLEALPPELPTDPEAVRLTREDPVVFEKDPSMNPEGLLLADSAAQVLETDGFGDLPLVVLAASDTTPIAEGFEPALGAAIVDIWWELQDELVALSSKGRLEKVDDSDHFIPGFRPDAVAAAIHEVLGD